MHAVTRDPAGRWVYVEGTGPHSGWYPHRFLIDTATGRYLARPGPDEELERFGLGSAVLGGRAVRRAPGRVPRRSRDPALRPPRDSAASHVGRAGVESATDLDDRLRPVPLGGVGVRGPRVRGLALRAAVGAARGDHDDPARLAPGRRPLPGGRRGPRLARPLEPGPRRAAPAEPRCASSTSRPTAHRAPSTFPIATLLDPMGDGRLGWNAVVPDAEGQRIVTGDAGLHLRDGATGELIATLVEGSRAIPSALPRGRTDRGRVPRRRRRAACAPRA